MEMVVAMLAPDFLPVWGGVGAYAVELVRNFPDDVEVHVITPFKKRIGDQKVSSSDYDFGDMFGNNVHIHFLSSASDTFVYNAKFQIAIWRKLKTIIKQNDVDIIHSAGQMPDLFINPNKLEVPIVTTIHTTIEGQINSIKSTPIADLEFSEKMTRILAPPLVFLENQYYAKRHYFITVSQLGKKIISMEKMIPGHMIKVIYNGVDTTKFSPSQKKNALRTFLEFSDVDTAKILYLSRLIGKKGIYILLKAIPKVLEKVDAHFIFVGSGIKPDFVSYGIPDSAYTYLGYLPEDHKPLIYAIVDIFVLPSFYENFPISILEAMASGTPVISTPVGGIPEMVTSGYNGLLVPPRDADSLARALVTLIENDGLRKKMGRNARKTVLRKFTWKKTAELTKRYYEEILKGGMVG